MNLQNGIHADGLDTLEGLLKRRREESPHAPALLAERAEAMSWSGLWELREVVVAALEEMGIEPGDRIAAALPNGPVLATAFLTIGSFTTFAPLNPTSQSAEFEFYFEDLGAKAVMLPEGETSPARLAAGKLNLPVLEVIARGEERAGSFQLRGASGKRRTSVPRAAAASDVALALHTSGTTSRPKLVPLTHRNLCGSARNIAATLALTPADRCLCMMPLFHIHGLVGALLASVTAGAAVACAPKFSANDFGKWLEEFNPTWYTAVPTMHQAVLEAALKNRAIIDAANFRLIRSSSAALPRQVMEGLEAAFGAPVIESYGMTEAAHQMASNPLPPGVRKPGSVGRAAGPEVAIMDAEGCLLKAGETGEIVIRGASVTAGYDHNAPANATAFTNGWFRTGDQGRMDAEGYLYISGRLKELINRGGEKISPHEIDQALLSHPRVSQAVAFATRHPTLGEDVAAAVVARGEPPGEGELRANLAESLPAWKVPSRIVFVEEIPKGPTGKLRRVGLADLLAKQLAVAYEAPRGELEIMAASTIGSVLGTERVGRFDNFFSLGGDSIRAMQVAARLSSALGWETPPTALFTHPTVAALAGELARLQESREVEELAHSLAQLPPEEVEKLLAQSTAGS